MKQYIDRTGLLWYVGAYLVSYMLLDSEVLSNCFSVAKVNLGVLSPLDNSTGYNEPLDLGGTFVDLIDFGISHQFLYRVVAVESVASKHLEGKRLGEN